MQEMGSSVFYVEGCRAESSNRFQQHGSNIIEESSESGKISTNGIEEPATRHSVSVICSRLRPISSPRYTLNEA
jgi:hypothetical protein